MGYLAYLYDQNGELWRIEDIEWPEPVLHVHKHSRLTQHDDPPEIKTFDLIEQGRTVRSLPRAVYRERHA
jgi:hypothetical protein